MHGDTVLLNDSTCNVHTIMARCRIPVVIAQIGWSPTTTNFGHARFDVHVAVSYRRRLLLIFRVNTLEILEIMEIMEI